MKNGARIAVDAMGGDFAPEVNIRGSVLALHDLPELTILLVGDERLLARELKRLSSSERKRIKVVQAADVISMDDSAAVALRKKSKSSIHVGINLVKSGEADAFISAGNSGAVMGIATHLLGTTEGVDRPAILVKLPTSDGFVTILDAGANVDCKSKHLVQFAEMGNLYAEVIEGIKSPRVGLLSNGSEPSKGTAVTRAANERLQSSDHLNYLGYVEGYDLFRGNVDVAVCDGFVGNAVLKSTEGVAETVFRWFRKELRKNVIGLVGVAFLRKVLKKFRDRFDYQAYGAAPLLGINGMVMISHGSSSEKAIRNGIRMAVKGVENRFIEKISARLKFGERSEKNNR